MKPDLARSPKPILRGNLPLIQPNWPAPAHVHAFTTTRLGGVSIAPFDSLNLSVTGLDNRGYENRAILRQSLNLPNEPIWLSQTHTTIAVNADEVSTFEKPRNADASFSKLLNTVCIALTADCLPLLICNRQGTEITSIHAGWRGLCDGIIENTINALQSNSADLLVWLGPAISPHAFEVGPEVRTQFIERDEGAAECFSPSNHRKAHFMGDIYALARRRLQRLGIDPANIYGGDYCTHNQKEWFFSYRRDGKTFGNLASLIWMSE